MPQYVCCIGHAVGMTSTETAHTLTDTDPTFTAWLETFVNEKSLDRGRTFEVEGPEWGINVIPLEVVIEHMRIASTTEQQSIKEILIYHDFRNADPTPLFEHLARGLAR